jgi:hypothetical protein
MVIDLYHQIRGDEERSMGFVSEEAKIDTLDASTAPVLPSISNYVEVFSLAITET